MKIKLIDEKCILTKGYISDAGWDLRAAEEKILMRNDTMTIKTGVCIEIPKGYAGDIRPRSSTSKKGLLVHYGTVDHGYTGEIGVTVTYLGDEPFFQVNKYERFAQLVINKIHDDNLLEIVDKLEDSARGENGFGSTGRN